MKMLRFSVALVICLLPAAGLLADENQSPELLEKFQLFLEQSLQKKSIGNEDIDAFYKRTYAFWAESLQDYLDHPQRYQTILSLYYKNQALYRRGATTIDVG